MRLGVRPGILGYALVGAMAVGLGVAVGTHVRELRRGPFAVEVSSSAVATGAGKAALTRALRDAVWELGDGEAVGRMVARELADASEVQRERRLQALIWAALLSDNPEGQSAILSQACALDEELCRQPGAMKRYAAREASRRHVPPGNRLPMIFLGAEHSESVLP